MAFEQVPPFLSRIQGRSCSWFHEGERYICGTALPQRLSVLRIHQCGIGSNGKIKRSAAAKEGFRSEGEAHAPSNLQWQTNAEAIQRQD